MLTVIVVEVIDVPNAIQVFIWKTDNVAAVAYSLTVSAAQATVICVPNVKLVFILTMEFAKIVVDCVLIATMPLFVQNVDLKTHS